MGTKNMLLAAILVGLVGLSFVPFYTKSLMMGGEIKINFWQKYFMKID